MDTTPKPFQTLKSWAEEVTHMSTTSNPRLLMQLELHRCPHCSIARPHLIRMWGHVTVDHSKRNRRFWAAYQCDTCGGIVTAWGVEDAEEVVEMYPSSRLVNESIPTPAADYLQQALE